MACQPRQNVPVAYSTQALSLPLSFPDRPAAPSASSAASSFQARSQPVARRANEPAPRLVDRVFPDRNLRACLLAGPNKERCRLRPGSWRMCVCAPQRFDAAASVPLRRPYQGWPTGHGSRPHDIVTHLGLAAQPPRSPIAYLRRPERLRRADPTSNLLGFALWKHSHRTSATSRGLTTVNLAPPSQKTGGIETPIFSYS